MKPTISLSLTETEAVDLSGLIDIAVKAGGIKVAGVGDAAELVRDSGWTGMAVAGLTEAGVAFSSQVNIGDSNSVNYVSVSAKCKATEHFAGAMCCDAASNLLTSFATGIVDGAKLDVGGGLYRSGRSSHGCAG